VGDVIGLRPRALLVSRTGVGDNNKARSSSRSGVAFDRKPGPGHGEVESRAFDLLAGAEQDFELPKLLSIHNGR
jgi:hypothetical protein